MEYVMNFMIETFSRCGGFQTADFFVRIGIRSTPKGYKYSNSPIPFIISVAFPLRKISVISCVK